ncbi:MAG: ankyrin repeat domain-containing protein [Tatlockia sp.]|nr:ankyrin repeat domain-containing protein [Tatlockia sp.]
MIINTPEKKQLHPLAAKIPLYFWVNVFDRSIDTDRFNIAEIRFIDIQRTDLPESDYQALILLMIIFPGQQLSEYLEHFDKKPPKGKIFILSATLGRIDILKEFKEKGTAKDWAAFRKTVHYDEGFYRAAGNNQLNTLKFLKEEAPNEWIAMVRAFSYASFRFATEYGYLDILQWLKEQAPNEWVAMVKVNDYAGFRIAVECNQLNTLKFLKEQAPNEWIPMLKVFNYAGFRRASTIGHLDILKFLKEQAPNEWTAMVKAEQYYGFRMASEKGHLDTLIWLKEQEPNDWLAMVKAAVFYAFRQASSNNHFNILKFLVKHAPNERIAMVKADDYYGFRKASYNGQIDAIKWFKEQAPSEWLAMVKAENYSAFRGASEDGHLDIIKFFSEHAPNELKEMIKAVDFFAFRRASKNGHLDTIKFIKDQAPDEWMAMVKANNYDGFREASQNGHLDTLKFLREQTPNEWIAMVKADNYYGFRIASEKGYLDILKMFKEQAPSEWIAMVKEDDYVSFLKASKNGHLDILKWFKEQAPNEYVAMVKTQDYGAFNIAYPKHKDTLKWLLLQPQCFAYAEPHVREFSHLVNPVVADILSTLHQESEAFSIQAPNGVFNIEDAERAQLGFYIIRNLIRRNDRAFDDELRFLLAIPAVKSLVHQEVTAGRPNELLRLAMDEGNQLAASLLLAILAVRYLADQNNFYQEERRNGVDLRQLANDDESSMVALTEGEAKRLHQVTARYQPMIQKAGVNAIIGDFKATLEKRYSAEPARISGNGKTIPLPISFKEFKALTLTHNQTQDALKAYHQHPTHTAWRYISKPNHWMHRHASYVYMSADRSERWSTFEEYKPLIAIMYLAATDKDMAPTTEYTLDSRFQHFINEIALIGRAHNWDKSRIRNGKQEEYDDLEGDRPSCFSGVNRRLFQSVVGHPLFDRLTAEKVEAELRQFVFTLFKSCLTRENQVQIKQVLDECFLEGEEDNIALLNCLDIPIKKQMEFIYSMNEKYGSQFEENEAFLIQITDAFYLDVNAKESRFRFHVLKPSLHDVSAFYDYLALVCSTPTKIEELPDIIVQHSEQLCEQIINLNLEVANDEVHSSIEKLRKKINKAILGTEHIRKPINDMPQKNLPSYLGWMSENATGSRGLSRFSHWFHGDSGVQRARDLLVIANHPNASLIQIQNALKIAYQDSGAHKHSLSRYLEAQLSNQDFLSLEALEDSDFDSLKENRNKFN